MGRKEHQADLKAFVKAYKRKRVPVMTVKDFMKGNNHEVWRKCPKCGAFNDLRKNIECEQCNTELK